VTDAPEPRDREILTLVWVVRALERACTELSLPQYRLLALIMRGEERASGLAGQLSLARPTVSAAVETLVVNGLVERTSVSGDRRAVRLTITPAGRGARRAAER
jgi:DNA-binding MarR family transcriptional regulator